MPLWGKLTRRQVYTLRYTAIALAVSLFFALLMSLGRPFSSLQWRLSDQLFLSYPPSPNIVIVAIDDESLAVKGKWSDWKRSEHIQAIHNLKEAGARVIGFDILFTDPSSEDALLAEAISQAGNVVLAVAGTQPIPAEHSAITYQRVLLPVTELRQASAALGHSNLPPDGDGVVRRLPLMVRDSTGQHYPSLPIAMLYTFFNKPLPQDYSITGGKIHLLDRVIPVSSVGSMRINFVGAPGTYPRLSYLDVIQGDFDPDLVKHKIVLVGMTATGEPDSWVTPASPEKMYGVEIYAHAIDTILRQRFLVESSRPVDFLLTLLPAAIAAVLLPRMRLRTGWLVVAGLAAGYLLMVFMAFDRGYILNILYPLIGLPLVSVTVLLSRVLGEQADKRFIRELFGRYVSPQVAGEIINLADAGELKLGGERREVTVLFADMRGFTRLSEQSSPEEIVNLLNQFLSLIIARVLANQGMVNKFAGDNVMGVWNAPQRQPDHALAAVKAAYEAQQAIKNLRETNPNIPQVQFGIGVNTGEAIAGNMGSEGRTEYTVIGDAVNLASRLCSAAPGDEVWIGPGTYELSREYIEVIPLEPQLFKGKKDPIPVYKVVGIEGVFQQGRE